MAQGNTKGLKSKAASGGRKKGGTMKKGRREIAPKQVDRVREKVHQKQLSSKINNSIEKQMVQAASAGKLSIMKGAAEVEPARKGKK
ncbi:hypothetical protein Q5752_002655 [Cryptotrichosporon argae]